MTTLVGIRFGNRVWVGSDTLLTGNDQRIGYLSKTAVVPHDIGGDSCVAIAGPATAIHAIQDTVSETSFGPWFNTVEVYKGMCEIHSYLETNHFLKPQADDESTFSPSGYQAIVANENGMWMVLSAREVVPVRSFCAVGSGREYALGALYGLDLSVVGPEAAIRVALGAASHYDLSTGSEIEVWSNELVSTQPVAEPKPKRQRKGGKS